MALRFPNSVPKFRLSPLFLSLFLPLIFPLHCAIRVINFILGRFLIASHRHFLGDNEPGGRLPGIDGGVPSLLCAPLMRASGGGFPDVFPEAPEGSNDGNGNDDDDGIDIFLSSAIHSFYF
ncbi:MAG: hypothetical protein LBD60_04085 [Puniceicoccales bacterium]|nr:hypothetical protein [Puniceicoccales bacterium]